MANTVDKVIKIAEAEIGYLEKSKSAYQKDPKVLEDKKKGAGKDNYTKYGKWIGLTPAYWCCQFISWIFNQAYGKDIGKKLLCGGFSSGCETIRGQFVKAKQYNSKPIVGSIIFFKGSRHAGANHIGIVYKVDSTYVYTIEGNTSDGTEVIDNGGAVCKRKYKLSHSGIMGYGQPKYDVATPTKPATPVKKAYSGTFPALPKVAIKDKKGKVTGYRTWYQLNDKSTQIKYLKQFLNWYGDYKLLITDTYDAATVTAVKKFQKAEKLTVDGEFGNDSLTKAKSIKK